MFERFATWKSVTQRPSTNRFHTFVVPTVEPERWHITYASAPGCSAAPDAGYELPGPERTVTGVVLVI